MSKDRVKALKDLERVRNMVRDLEDMFAKYPEIRSELGNTMKELKELKRVTELAVGKLRGGLSTV